jgi:hypothetical protein
MNIIETLTNLGASFASFTYTDKPSKKGELPETARYTVILGGKYSNLLEKSKLELELLIPTLSGIELEAANEIMASLNKSIEAAKNGTQNEDYTKKGQYTNIGNGVNINSTDNSVQVFGLLQSKVVLKAGFRKPVNSAPLTVAKNKIRKMLPIGKFREFAFDMGNIKMVKVDGQTVVFQNQIDLDQAAAAVAA